MRDEVGDEIAGPADPTLQQREAERGNRWTTPPRISAFAKAWLALAKWPMWLNVKLLTDSRPIQPMLPECVVTATFSSTQRAQNGS